MISVLLSGVRHIRDVKKRKYKMNYINKIVSRIEKGNAIVLNFDYDQFTKVGDKANVVGLTRWENRWYVEIEPHASLGSSDSITLVDYMEKTKDIT